MDLFRKSKPLDLSPFFFHLYHANECLRGPKLDMYEVQEVKLTHGMKDSIDEKKEEWHERKEKGESSILVEEKELEGEKSKGKEKVPEERAESNPI